MTYEEIEDGVRKAMVALLDAASEYTKYFESSPEHERIYRLARKLCEIEGYDPDRISMGYANGCMVDAKKSMAIILPIRPNWMLYIDDVQRAIGLVEGEK